MEEIINVAQANWAIKKIAEHMTKIREYESQRDFLIDDYQSRIDLAKDICAENCDEHFRAIDSLKLMLREYAAGNMPAGKKTLRLPEGNLKFTSKPAVYAFEDGGTPSASSQRLIEYLKNNGKDYIKTTTTVSADWANFKKSLDYDSDGTVFNKVTGEVIIGLHAEKPADTFEVVI